MENKKNIEVNAGYEIRESVSICNNTYVLGHNPNPKTPAPFVTWAKPKDDYYVFGHYFTNESDARQDLLKRAMEHLSERDTDELALSVLSDEAKAAIMEEGRMENRLGDIEACLYDAADHLKLDLGVVPELMGNEDFIARALHVYHNQDHSYENEALTESLEFLIKERFPQVLSDNSKDSELQSFFYTFGTSETQPFEKGWIEVQASDAKEADEIFRASYPDKIPGLLNYASVYDEETFARVYQEHYKGTSWDVCHGVLSPEPTRHESLADKIMAAEGKKMISSMQSQMENKEPQR